ncbi:MAG: nuclear transport factor 2 family protein [Bacteroidota bacterium]
MNTSLNIFKIFLIILQLVFGMQFLQAQGLKKEDPLYKEVAHMDSVLFNAFNSRDLTTFEKTFSPDLEFYHDKGGLTNLAYTLNSLRNQAERKSDLRRELVVGSTEIYPVKDFGAIQIGQHRFCHTENAKPDCGTFKFVHVWKKTGNTWQLVRVLSYDH